TTKLDEGVPRHAFVHFGDRIDVWLAAAPGSAGSTDRSAGLARHRCRLSTRLCDAACGSDRRRAAASCAARDAVVLPAVPAPCGMALDSRRERGALGQRRDRDERPGG